MVSTELTSSHEFTNIYGNCGIFTSISDDESDEPLMKEQLQMYMDHLNTLEKVLDYHYLPSEESEMSSFLAMLNLTHVNVSCYNFIQVNLLAQMKFQK